MPKPAQVPEILPNELLAALEDGQPVQVVDVRAPARVQMGRIDMVPDGRFRNIVGSQLAMMRTGAETGLDPEVPVAVVCGHGNSSKPATLFLNHLGFTAHSVRGGMAAWMLLAVPRQLAAPPSLDALLQFDRVGKGALGYLVASDGEALIVDPPRRADAYEAAARDANARIVAVADTHAHADYISGAPALAQSLGVPYYLHPADSVYPYDDTPGAVQHEPLRDGAEIRVGRATVRAVHTPGHTQGSVTYMIDDAVALTGDFIFIDSVGRPDLAGKAAAWTERLADSIELAKASWPHTIMVHPAHYGGDGERNADRTIGARFGDLLTQNAVLALADRESLARWVLDRTATAPAAYPTIKAVNVGLRMVSELEAEELEVGKHECAVGA